MRYLHAFGQNYKVEFETAGSGSYWATCLGENKGPFTDKDAAMRWVKAKLEGLLAEQEAVSDPANYNAAPEADDPEIQQATAQAMAEADKREAEGTLGSDSLRAEAAERAAEDEADLMEADDIRRMRREQLEAEGKPPGYSDVDNI